MSPTKCSQKRKQAKWRLKELPGDAGVVLHGCGSGADQRESAAFANEGKVYARLQPHGLPFGADSYPAAVTDEAET
jgi:hypothetical protein